jgi:hypothetical protein
MINPRLKAMAAIALTAAAVRFAFLQFGISVWFNSSSHAPLYSES